jgi:hypothetical protein
MAVHGMHREASIEINASPEAVYALVSDLPRMGEWSPENIGGEWQDGGSGKVGDRYIGHNRAGERSWSVPVMVTVAEWSLSSLVVAARFPEHRRSRARSAHAGATQSGVPLLHAYLSNQTVSKRTTS